MAPDRYQLMCMSRMRGVSKTNFMRKGDIFPRTERTRGCPTAYGAGRDELSTDSAEKSSTSLMRKDKSSRRPQETSPALQRFVQT